MTAMAERAFGAEFRTSSFWHCLAYITSESCYRIY